MAGWGQIEREAPELTAVARPFFDAFTHKTLATLRRDGAPRISGIELDFSDGEAWIGSMGQAVKALDLQSDQRFAPPNRSAPPPRPARRPEIAGRAAGG